MLFHSTRGLCPHVDARTAAMEGLAPDGGLYLPLEWPRFSAQDIANMRERSYQDIALRVMAPFLNNCFPQDVLSALIDKAYASFENPDITPLRALGDNYLLELFHGPTLAFKDVALQFVGLAFDAFLRHSGEHKTVIGATSGDTGSAAIAALAGREGLDVFILYPEHGPSEVQRRQMTCVDAANVHALAIKGSFDDCQAIVKALFSDDDLRRKWSPTTANSINFLRILAQIVYYFFAASRLDAVPSFVVPTGNFGDVFAGYAAKKCGLPIETLVVASNSNNILTRFFNTGHMDPQKVFATLSPSMDIQISSNFERLLFDLCGQGAQQVSALMSEMKNTGSYHISPQCLAKAKKDFAAGCATDDETLDTIRSVYEAHGYILDPHTAVGVKVAQDLSPRLSKPVVCLATAHPAKFPETIDRALGFSPPQPTRIQDLMTKTERTFVLPASVQAVASFIEQSKKS